MTIIYNFLAAAFGCIGILLVLGGFAMLGQHYTGFGSVNPGLINIVIGLAMFYPFSKWLIKRNKVQGGMVMSAGEKVSPVYSDEQLIQRSQGTRACLECGYVGQINQSNKGSCLLVILLLFLFLIPGILYLLWMSVNTGFKCPKCDAWRTVPLNTPKGREIFEKLPENQKQWVRDLLSL